MPAFSIWDQVWALDLSFSDALLRLMAALACGAIIGVERESRHRPAGLRTHMIVALASALFTIIAFQIYGEVERNAPRVSSDPLRLLEAITSGVAFLAAGAIIRRGEGVRGITTGAGLWLAGALGMACGRGYFGLGFLGAFLALGVLSLVRLVEERTLR